MRSQRFRELERRRDSLSSLQEPDSDLGSLFLLEPRFPLLSSLAQQDEEANNAGHQPPQGHPWGAALKWGVETVARVLPQREATWPGRAFSWKSVEFSGLV